MKSFSAYYQENRNTNPARLRSLGSHLDSPQPSLVASFQTNKAAHYTGKIKRKSKVGEIREF
jgi:hypothetical protein